MILATPGADSRREGNSKGREKSAKKSRTKAKIPLSCSLELSFTTFFALFDVSFLTPIICLRLSEDEDDLPRPTIARTSPRDSEDDVTRE